MKAHSQGRIPTSPKPRLGSEFQRALCGDFKMHYSVETQSGHPERVALAFPNGKISEGRGVSKTKAPPPGRRPDTPRIDEILRLKLFTFNRVANRIYPSPAATIQATV